MKEGDTVLGKETHSFSCSFCGKGVVLGELLPQGTFLTHELPACEEFTRMGVEEFLDKSIAILRN